MGLNCSHGAWRGSYSAFSRWRCKLAEVAGLPPLQLMEKFYVPLRHRPGWESWEKPTFYCENTEDILQQKLVDVDSLLPIKWECLKPDPLHELLSHSDSDGEIAPENCRLIADSLEKLIPLLPDEDAGGHVGNWREKTRLFVLGLRSAANNNEPLLFR